MIITVLIMMIIIIQPEGHWCPPQQRNRHLLYGFQSSGSLPLLRIITFVIMITMKDHTKPVNTCSMHFIYVHQVRLHNLTKYWFLPKLCIKTCKKIFHYVHCTLCRNTTKIPLPLTRNLACLTARDITFQGKLNFSETGCKEKLQLVLPDDFLAEQCITLQYHHHHHQLFFHLFFSPECVLAESTARISLRGTSL